MLKNFCGALLAFVLAFGFVQDAGAKPRSIVLPGGTEFSFTLRASHGYGLEVSASRESAEITVAGSSPSKGLVMYSIGPRKFNERGFEAKLPGVGRIAVRFHPSGPAKKLPPFEGCHGKPGKLERGRFVGTINFHGELGYTDVTATRARGTVEHAERQACPVEKGGRGGDKGSDAFQIDTTLTAGAKKGLTFFNVGRVKLSGEFAETLETEALVTYSAGQLSFSHGMMVIRGVSSTGADESFSAENTGRSASARVEPGPPFSGSAEFGIETDGTVNWTGDLSVTFPGTGPVRLTGKRFDAQLCVRNKCAGDAASSSAAPTPRLWPR